MEDSITTFLLGGGGTLLLLNLVLGIVELLTLRTIRPPKRKSFAHIRLAETQFQTVIAPAMGAIISGLFVSLAASFLYSGLTSESESWHQNVGGVVFFAGVIVLMVTLRLFLKGVGEPTELTRDPFTIRAAAEESAAHPRQSTLGVDVLNQQLCDWKRYISAHSMDLSARRASDRLDRELHRAKKKQGFWTAMWLSFRIYYAASLRFPFRFGWPLLGFTLYGCGVVWFAVGVAELDFTGSSRPWFVVALHLGIAAAVTLFYFIMRGNRARLLHRIHLDAFVDAREAIEKAKEAHSAVKDEDALLQRVIDHADSFFRHTAPNPKAHTIFRLGRFRVSVTPKRHK